MEIIFIIIVPYKKSGMGIIANFARLVNFFQSGPG
jgi:hypothetical protein